MAQYYNDIYVRYLRLAALLAFSWGALCCGGAAFGLTRTEIYQTTVPVPDRSEASQSAAFQAAMRVVLVRVTGRRSADEDAALAPLLGSARRYVQQYRGAPDSQLWVAFDGPAIERWLTQNGQPLWGRDRPSTFVWLGVQTGPQAGILVTADDTSELKGAIVAAAAARGVPLVWPSAADLEKNHLDYSSVSGTGTANAGSGSLGEIARRLGADGVLIGRATNATASAGVRWTHQFQDRSSELSGTVEGVNRAADTYASLFAASGVLAPVDIEVSGVADLKAYASVQTYLESLSFVSHVSVQALTGDVVKYRLTTRGGVESLQRALALNGRLQSLPVSDNGIQRFQLRR
ncbi:MAG: uncharacterized protein QOD56_1786 [Gammaproteobacteria bacterium]|nr:uncharacterized protein [Gammaproteobacteria bacterium]